MAFLVRIVLCVGLALCAAGGSGCAHVVRIETNPVGARVVVDGDVVGNSPVEVKKTVFVGDQLRVAVEADGYEPQTVIVPASEWYPWPGLIACTPALGVPIATPFAVGLLPFCGAGLFVGPAIAVGWAVVTSPTLLALGLVRKYPERVTVTLRRREGDGAVVLPGEMFYIPDETTPNPLPLPDATPPPRDPTIPLRGVPSTSDTPPSPGGNPLP